MRTAMRTALLTVFLAGLAAAAGRAEDKRAKTEDGKDVILKSDGTWAYADEPKKDKKAAAGEYKHDRKAVLAYKGKRGTFAMYLPVDSWKKLDKIENESAEVGFMHKDGDMMAMVIAEGLEMPLETLKKLAVTNMQSVDPAGKVVAEEKRKVNGRDVLCLTLEAVPQGVAVTFLNYYYTGDEGSMQVVTWTGRKLFKKAKPEMEAFLNGFVVITPKE